MKDLNFKTKDDYVTHLVYLMNEVSESVTKYRNKKMTDKNFHKFLRENKKQAMSAHKYAVEKGLVNEITPDELTSDVDEI